MKPIIFKNRYSQTLEPDKMGRWACVAYCGDRKLFKKGRVSFWEIAWIKQFEHEGIKYFTIHANFPFDNPSNIKGGYKTLEEAKKEVVKGFRWFIKNCCTISI